MGDLRREGRGEFKKKFWGVDAGMGCFEEFWLGVGKTLVSD